jgi:tetratricopeptide (TPR) repeat protein
MLLFILILCAIYPTLYYSALHYEHKGIELLQQGKYQDAIDAFDIGIKLKPRKDALCYYGKGVALAKMGKLDEAKKLFDQAISHKPGAIEVYGKEMNFPKESFIEHGIKIDHPEKLENKKDGADKKNEEIKKDDGNKKEMENVDADDEEC